MAADAETEVARLLKEHGAVLARHRKHFIWKFPDGRTFTQACTPSDIHAHDNQLRQLRGLLGVNGERGQPGERRERKTKVKRPAHTPITPSINTEMCDKLLLSGVAEAASRAEIQRLRDEVRHLGKVLWQKNDRIERLERNCLSCPACRFRWYRRRLQTSGSRFARLLRFLGIVKKIGEIR